MSLGTFDGIIILSHLMDSNGNLDSESCLRADKAVEIYRINIKAKIITCGWDYRKDSKIKIANAMSDYLYNKHNIQKDKIIIEPNSRDTVGDAIFTRKYILPNEKFKSLAIITSSYHAKRTEEIFKFVYGNRFILKLISCDLSFGEELNYESEINSLKKFRETFAGVENGNIQEIYSRLLTKHPFYNGEIFQYNGS